MRPVSLQSIVDRARVHADMRQSKFIKDDVALMMLNEIYPKLYDILVAADGNFYSSRHSFSIGSGQSEYPLPDDFYKLITVEITSTPPTDGLGAIYITLQPVNEDEKNSFFSISVPSATVRVKYAPAPPVFTSLAEEVDGIAGWDRMLSLLLAIDMLDAEESNTDRLYRKYNEEVSRITTLSKKRDIGMPATVTDISRTGSWYRWDFINTRYILDNNSIQFVTSLLR